MALKIDLEKAYDRVKWSFVLRCLEEMNLLASFIDLISNCLSPAKMQVLWNGKKGEKFSPSQGLRQGDPISPYLFVLVMEKLGHMIQGEVDNENWIPFKLQRNGVGISHLFFADDFLLFVEASMDQAGIIKLWISRNLRVFQQKKCGVWEVLAQVQVLVSWSNPEPLSIKMERDRVQWRAPEMEVVKFSIDSASGQDALKRAWDMGWRRIVIETDCMEAIKMLQNDEKLEHSNHDLIAEIQSMRRREWTVDLTWCH
ncbi:uncharacterized protein LOC129300662 [Prosopis cineraria]|uniref:uncharacterized protein LOC129300662 n=1 Tax=Prosopis cineraria TaxID=364024 RepID=UPI0024100B7E|nr:uncharacterized protein LOC129300662 [Prosopis cineraria]